MGCSSLHDVLTPSESRTSHVRVNAHHRMTVRSSHSLTTMQRLLGISSKDAMKMAFSTSTKGY